MHRRTASPAHSLSATILLLAAIGCRQSAAASDPPPAAARVDGTQLVLPANSPQLASLRAIPASGTAAVTVALTGRLAWDEDVTVRVFSPFAGRVERILADVGRPTKRGEALAIIDAPDFGQAQADARRATTDLGIAQRTSDRQRDLLQHGIVAQKDVEAADADVARARAEAQRATARLALYGGDTTSVNEAFPLRAPLGGTVVERSISPGQEVRPDQMLANAPQLFAPLFVITDPSHLWVLLDVSEQDMPSLRVGAPFVVRAQAWPNRTFGARITHIAAAIDPTTRTLKVRGEVANADGALKAEMLVSAELRQPAAASISVPTSAVLLQGESHVVFVETQPGRFQRREIHVGPAHDGVVPVVDGLRVGERVVTTSALLLEQLYQTTAHS